MRYGASSGPARITVRRIVRRGAGGWGHHRRRARPTREGGGQPGPRPAAPAAARAGHDGGVSDPPQGADSRALRGAGSVLGAAASGSRWGRGPRAAPEAYRAARRACGGARDGAPARASASSGVDLSDWGGREPLERPEDAGYLAEPDCGRTRAPGGDLLGARSRSALGFASVVALAAADAERASCSRARRGLLSQRQRFSDELQILVSSRGSCSRARSLA